MLNVSSEHSFNKIKNFIEENIPNRNTDFVTDTILNWESPFALACKKICREKALSSYFKKKDCYIEPVEKIVSYDYKTGKPNCLQIYSNTFDIKQLKVLLQQWWCTRKHHCVYTATTQMISVCLIISIKVSFFWNNELFSNILLAVQIIPYRDDLQVSNPLGNKIKKQNICILFCFREYFCKIWVKITTVTTGNSAKLCNTSWKL